MNVYKLIATSINNNFVQFSISDFPTPIDDKYFILLGRQGSEFLLINSIRRGDPDTNLFEGDVVETKDSRWMICYEHGFYAINEDFIRITLKQLTDIQYTYVGFEQDVKFSISIFYKKRHLFKYKDVIFKLDNIVGTHDGKLLINLITQPVDVSRVQQECGLLIGKRRMYLGDKYRSGVIDCHMGTLVVRDKEKITPLV